LETLKKKKKKKKKKKLPDFKHDAWNEYLGGFDVVGRNKRT
jgi:hypothetical protein